MKKVVNRQAKLQSKKKHLGQGMTEYIIIVGVIAIAAIGAFSYFGDTLEYQVAGMAAELAGKDGSGMQTEAGNSADDVSTVAGRSNTLGNYYDQSAP